MDKHLFDVGHIRNWQLLAQSYNTLTSRTYSCYLCSSGVWCMVTTKSLFQSMVSSSSCSLKCWTHFMCSSCSHFVCGLLMTTCIMHWQFWPCLCSVLWWQCCRLGRWVDLWQYFMLWCICLWILSNWFMSYNYEIKCMQDEQDISYINSQLCFCCVIGWTLLKW